MELNMLRFIDLFAGIGGTRQAFERLGNKCVFTSEYDKYCQITYAKNFGDMPSGDITVIDEKAIPDHDILIGGFPCQPFSIAGVSKKISLGRKHGFDDVKQGNLFFDIVRILDEKKPRAFMLENVKNLRSHDKGRTFEIIRNTLEDLGYHVYDKVIDARDYVPQHRERIFIVGFRKDVFPEINFEYPLKPTFQQPRIADILEKDVDDKFTLTDGLWAYLQKYAAGHKAKGNGFGFGLIDPVTDSTSRTLSARYYKDGSEILIKQDGKNPRRLTPRECARLMGFPDTFEIPVSNTQAYKQFGNSIVIPVVQAVATQMMLAMGSANGQIDTSATKPKYVKDSGKKHEARDISTPVSV
jgi:DNA (cytosine-5)-methyltransferase 1